MGRKNRPQRLPLLFHAAQALLALLHHHHQQQQQQQRRHKQQQPGMAPKKAATLLVKLLSTAGTGYFYVARKNPRKLPKKLEFVK